MKVDETPLYTQKEEIGIYRRPVIRVMSGEEEISTDSPWFLSLNSSVSPQIIMSGSSALTTASVEGTLLESWDSQELLICYRKSQLERYSRREFP